MNNTPKKKKTTHNDITVYSLGGLGVVGMNMYIVETNKELLIMDSGILFADDSIHGVEYIILKAMRKEQSQRYLSAQAM